jgi:hypothetical protein
MFTKSERLIFCDFIVPGMEPRIYEQVKFYKNMLVKHCSEFDNSISGKITKYLQLI